MPHGFVGDLQMDDALPFHQREWRVKRIAWGFFGLLLLVSLAGFLGSGPFSDATVQQDGLTVRYERYLRARRESELEITLRTAETGTVRLLVDQSLAERANIKSIVPAPKSVTANNGRLEHEFQSKAKETTIKIEFEPRKMGQLKVGLASPGSGKVQLQMWVHP